MFSKLKKNYFLLISTFLILYFLFSLFDGERGLFSYFKKKEILKEWASRNEEFYIKLFSKINLKKVDSYRYLQNTCSIFVGKK